MNIIAPIGKWLRREFVAAWPIFVFFLAGFLLLLLIIKLALAKFSVEMTALPKAIVGALFAAKAVLILDDTPLTRKLEHRRRIVAVAVKTLLYGAITLLLAYVEKVLEALHHVHKFEAATLFVIDQTGMYKLLAWALGISVLYAIYFAMFEISQRIGSGELWKLFFESPRPADDPLRNRALP